MSFVWRTRDAMIRQLRCVEAVVIDWHDAAEHAEIAFEPDPDHRRALPSATAEIARLADAGVPVAVIIPAARPVGRAEPANVRRAVEPGSSIPGRSDQWWHRPGPQPGGADWSAELPGTGSDALDVMPDRVALIADTVTAIRAAQSAGSVGILVPSSRTTSRESVLVPLAVGTLADAVDMVLGAHTTRRR